MHWLKFFTLVLLFTINACNVQKSDVSPDVKASSNSSSIALDDNLPWSVRMTESIIKRNPESWMTDFRKTPRWSYTHGLVLAGIQNVYLSTGNKAYFNYVKSYADKMIDNEGNIINYDITEYNIDHINPGKILFQLYEETGDERYQQVMHTLKKQLDWHPRTSEGGFWHKLKYTNQMWLDGLYMGAPYYAQYAKVNNIPEAFDDIANQFIIMEKHARDNKTGLLYHGWDESKVQKWANKETGNSPEFWGRAIGWYAMGLVDALDFIPQDHTKRDELIQILDRLAHAVSKYQDKETGAWWQVMDKANQSGNYKEATVTCMLAYSLIKAVRKGYIDEKYAIVARNAFDGIIKHFVEVEEDGEMHIHNCCAVAGLGGSPYRDGSYEYYLSEEIRSNDTKATGPFIMASLEFEMLENDQLGQN